MRAFRRSPRPFPSSPSSKWRSSTPSTRRRRRTRSPTRGPDGRAPLRLPRGEPPRGERAGPGLSRPDGPPPHACDLGGSSSVAAIRSGVAVDTSFGLSPQSGLPQNNRGGDMDAFAALYVMKKLGLDADEMARGLANESGLAGISGGSGDVRDLEAAAAGGGRARRLALDVFVQSVRHYVGAFLVRLGGLDAPTFSGGIGENSPGVRSAVCAGLTELGVSSTRRATPTRGASRLSPRARVSGSCWFPRTRSESSPERSPGRRCGPPGPEESSHGHHHRDRDDDRRSPQPPDRPHAEDRHPAGDRRPAPGRPRVARAPDARDGGIGGAPAAVDAAPLERSARRVRRSRRPASAGSPRRRRRRPCSSARAWA